MKPDLTKSLRDAQHKLLGADQAERERKAAEEAAAIEHNEFLNAAWEPARRIRDQLSDIAVILWNSRHPQATLPDDFKPLANLTRRPHTPGELVSFRVELADWKEADVISPAIEALRYPNNYLEFYRSLVRLTLFLDYDNSDFTLYWAGERPSEVGDRLYLIGTGYDAFIAHLTERLSRQ